MSKHKREVRMQRIPTGPAHVVHQPESLVFRLADGTIQVNTARLPVPERVYDADLAWAAIRHGVASLFFGKQGTDQELKSKIEIRYSFESFVLGFWRNSRDFHAKMKERLATRNQEILRERNEIHPETGKAEREQSFWANVDALARVGNEASVDFFHLPPRALALHLLHGAPLDDLMITPIVRVLLSTDELSRLLDSCEPLVESMGPFLERDR